MALKTHRQGNDFKLTLQVYRLNNAVSITNDTVPEGAVIEDLTDAQNIKLSLYCSNGACTILKKTVNVNVLVAEIPANIQAVGTYYVLLEYDKVDITLEDGLKRFTTDFDAFKIVDKSAYADTEGDMSLIGVVKVGLDGKSSYQYAQEHGYTGTEEEFGQLQYESTLAAINEAERIIAEQQREETFNNKMTSINEAISTTNTATINANTAATNANDKAILAKSSADNADQKAELANEAAANANIATTLANEAKINAYNASLNANTAATNANDKATLADQKATLADSKATLANNAANTANTAATTATNAATSANNAANAANGQAGTYNVTVAVPLTAGNYYNSTTARSAVPSNVRLLGRVITYATSSGVWYTERFVGTDVLNWTTAANWEYVPRNSDLVQIGADLNLLAGVDPVTLSLSVEIGYILTTGSGNFSDTSYRRNRNAITLKKGQTISFVEGIGTSSIASISTNPSNPATYNGFIPKVIYTGVGNVAKYTATQDCYVYLCKGTTDSTIDYTIFVEGIIDVLSKDIEDLNTILGTINNNVTSLQSSKQDNLSFEMSVVSMNLAEMVYLNDNIASESNGYYRGWISNGKPTVMADTGSLAWRTYKFDCSDYIGKKITFGGDVSNYKNYAIWSDSAVIEYNSFASPKTVEIPSNAKWLYVIIGRYPTDDFSKFQINEGDVLSTYDLYTEGVSKINGNTIEPNGTEIDLLKKSIQLNKLIIDTYHSTSLMPKLTRLMPHGRKPVISFNFDINFASVDFEYLEQTMSIFEKYGLRFGIALRGADDAVAANKDKYIDYQRRGYDIINHSTGGKIYTIASELTAEQIATGNYITTYEEAQIEIFKSQFNLEKNGLVVNGWCSPSSTFSNAYLPILDMINAYAYTSTETSKGDTYVNGRDANPMRLTRTGFDSAEILDIESIIDSYILSDKCLVLYAHPNNIPNPDVPLTLTKIEEILQYCITKRDAGLCCLMNADDAIKYYYKLQ